MIEIGLVVLALLVLAFLIGSYVAATLGMIGVVLLLVFSDRPAWPLFGHMTWDVLSDTTLVAIPLFLLMGEILIKGGLMTAIYRALANWFGRLPGGLLTTNIFASGVFGSISGSSVSVAAAVGSIAIPQLYGQGYSRRMTLGSLAAGGTLGVLIPPSMILIIYGVTSGASVGSLFIATLIPAVMMTALYLLTVFGSVAVAKVRVPQTAPVPLRAKLRGSWPLVPVALLFAVVIGTIYLGVASPTESAAFGVIGALVVVLIQRAFSWRKLREALMAAARTTGMVMLLLLGAGLMQLALGYLGAQRALSQSLIDANLGPTMLLIVIVVAFLLLGSFVDDLAVMITMLPIILPTVAAAGVDLVWFGVLCVMLISAGLIAPGYGLNLFILHGVQKRYDRKASLGDAYIGALPFTVVLLLGIVILFLVPGIATWLPSIAR